jgi:hypothetical protein
MQDWTGGFRMKTPVVEASPRRKGDSITLARMLKDESAAKDRLFQRARYLVST